MLPFQSRCNASALVEPKTMRHLGGSQNSIRIVLTDQFKCKKTSSVKVDAASRRVLYFSCAERGGTPRLPLRMFSKRPPNVRLIMYWLICITVWALPQADMAPRPSALKKRSSQICTSSVSQGQRSASGIGLVYGIYRVEKERSNRIFKS
jgi:hypothetical protein